MAYLQTTPRTAHGRTRGRSRLQALRDEGATVPMPPVPREAQALLTQFLEVGPAGYGGTGPVPLSFAEIGAWQRVTAQRLTPGEAQLMRRLSVEYVSQHAVSDSPDTDPPWGPSVAHDRDDVSRRVRMLFGARAREKKRSAS